MPEILAFPQKTTMEILKSIFAPAFFVVDLKGEQRNKQASNHEVTWTERSMAVEEMQKIN